jgi:CRP/FNR family transcriptional regulator, cyclic AMP receptor protein
MLMHTPYGFELTDTCATCKFRADGFFCQLSPAQLRDFDAISHVSAYPAEAVLFVQQQKSRGFFQVCLGEVKLSVSSSEGKTLILRVAKPGDVIGIWPAISGAPY